MELSCSIRAGEAGCGIEVEVISRSRQAPASRDAGTLRPRSVRTIEEDDRSRSRDRPERSRPYAKNDSTRPRQQAGPTNRASRESDETSNGSNPRDFPHPLTGHDDPPARCKKSRQRQPQSRASSGRGKQRRRQHTARRSSFFPSGSYRASLNAGHPSCQYGQSKQSRKKRRRALGKGNGRQGREVRRLRIVSPDCVLFPLDSGRRKIFGFI